MTAEKIPGYAAFEALGETPGRTVELVRGELVVQPRPMGPHVEAAMMLGSLLVPVYRLGRGGPGGWVILGELDIVFVDEIRVPDVVGWRRERYERPEKGPHLVVPDWLCEVLSPGTAKGDRTEKLPLYARAGVRHVWIVDPALQTLEVFELRDGVYALVSVASGNAVVRPVPFDAVDFELGLLWAERWEKQP